MFDPEMFAINFARTVELLREHPPNKEAQKASLRAVYALTSFASASVRLYDGALSVDGAVVPQSLPYLDGLKRQMEGHGVAEVAVARGSTATELLAVLEALAVDVGSFGPGDGVAERVAASGAGGVAVLTGRPPEEPSVSDALREVLAAFETRPAVVQGVPAETPIGAALAAVVREAHGAAIGDLLSDLAREVGVALREGPIEPAVQAIAAVVGLEPGVPEGEPKRSYDIALKRMFARDALKRIALLLPDPRFAPVATLVLRRAGSEGADVVFELLTASAVPHERTAFLAAIRAIPKGTLHVIEMLRHTQWAVVRNMAELLGEMRFEEAVPELGKLLMHYEPQVRLAAIVALARIGTVATVAPLRRAMKEGTPDLRARIAGSIGGQHSRALAIPLVVLAAEEDDEGVLCEYFRALGRIGTPEAIDALVKAAQPGGRIFGRRPPGPRIAAVQSLGNIGGTAARRALDALQEDGDKAVREAVLHARRLP
jgi:HEAT repeat protein